MRPQVQNGTYEDGKVIGRLEFGQDLLGLLEIYGNNLLAKLNTSDAQLAELVLCDFVTIIERAGK